MIAFNKRLGETPLDALMRLKYERPELQKETLSYAGRLDPMAEGVLLVLVGEENKKREEYLTLDKTYVTEILLGVETDTYDVLGMPQKMARLNLDMEYNTDEINRQYFEKIVQTFVGERDQQYPPYSSKTVQGKPLWQWAREGNLHKIDIPTNKISIYKIVLQNIKHIESKFLHQKITQNIGLMKGDFRQDEILQSWNAYFDNKQKEFLIISLEVACSSGTYIRGLAHDLGIAFGTGACALSIRRTKIGDFSL